jgi:hypothetical protein
VAGPVTSGYPGTPVMLVVAGFSAFMLGKAVWLAVKARRDTASRRDWRGYVAWGIGATYLLATAIWAIYAHRS